MLCHLCYVVDLCTLDVAISACRFSCRVLAVGVGRALCHLCVALLLFVLSLCFHVCVCVFSSVSLFSPLCSCIGQALLVRINIMSVTAFLLMKNMLRYSRDKKDIILSSKSYCWAAFDQPVTAP